MNALAARRPRVNLRIAAVLVLVMLVSCCVAQAQESVLVEPTTSAQKAQERLADGDRLIDAKEYEQGLIEYKSAYELIVANIRGLAFKEPVRPRLMTRSELTRYMTLEFEKEFTPEEITLLDRMLKVFDLAPADLDVRQTLIKLFSEEVAGFYDPESKEMFLILEDPSTSRLGFLAALLGVGPRGFDKEGQKTTLSHEMAHALADQHFNLQALDHRVRENDDFSLAISALVEGEATLVMMGDAFSGEADLLQWPPERLDAMFTVMDWAMPIAGGRTMRQAPPYFRRSLIFPYHKGSVFVASLARQGGWDAINRAFIHPPHSTEQILHPEKFDGQRDEPSRVSLPQIERRAPAGWRCVGQNTMGEFQVQLVLEPSASAVEAAAGWDGDRYAVWEHEDGRLALTWETVWDSPADADAFAQAVQQRLQQTIEKRETPADAKRPLPSWQSQTRLVNNQVWGDVSCVDARGAYYIVQAQGDRVSVAYGFTPEQYRALARRLEVHIERR